MKTMYAEQPWASLIVGGALMLLTEDKAARKALLGRVAIWAGHNTRYIDLAATEPYSRYLPEPKEIPTGSLVGTVVVVRSIEITEAIAEHTEINRPTQFEFGDWTPGRFAWVLERPVKFAEPIKFPSHRPTVDESELPLNHQAMVGETDIPL